MPTKYQIFISSTHEDLRDEREHVIKAVLEMGHIPVGMEMFSAADDAQWNIIKRQIDQSDYYLVVVANRYGSTTDEGISYTEKEYDYAVQQAVPAIGFILDPSAPWPTKRNDISSDKRQHLDGFKEKLKKRLVSFWRSGDDLSGKVVIALTKLMTERPRPGWVRGSEVPTAEVLNEMSRLSKENATLRQQLAMVGEERQIVEAIAALRKKELQVSALGDSLRTTLFEFFVLVARNLVMDCPEDYIAGVFKEQVLSQEKETSMPIEPVVNSLLIELSILDLVTSRLEVRGRIAPYYEVFWTLTSFGKKVLATIEKDSAVQEIQEAVK